MNTEKYIKNIFNITKLDDFNRLAIELFNYQFRLNKTYNHYVNLIGCNSTQIQSYEEIPFLPIELFKTKNILSSKNRIQRTFFSSGTTGSQKSKHHVIDELLYQRSIIESFKLFFGSPKEYVFICLAPNLENSSLSYMCSTLINYSNNQKSGFYLQKHDEIIGAVKHCQKEKEKFILFGLSFALLEFAENYKLNLKGGIIIETGGMKNKRQDIVREDLYNYLANSFFTKKIYSEYSMTELLSQSYLIDGHFHTPPWKKVIIRDKNNPLAITNDHSLRGCINIIDLANIHSCGFIATNDLGKLVDKGFDILGRAQNSSERGCSLMLD